jgi:hypothetical protein
MTLEQVNQQVAGAANPLARLGRLSIEKAKQHRLGLEADYFPKFSATFVNLHFSDFLGQVIGAERLGGRHHPAFPLFGNLQGFAVPLFSQNQTAVNVSLIQPVTPIFQVHQAVKIARADERIAQAKAAAPIAANAASVEETYYKLLIAQRRLTYAKWNLKSVEHEPPAEAASIISVRVTASGLEPREAMEVQTKLATAVTEVRELTASLDRLMGWPDDTPLELVPPDPLVENISLQAIADKGDSRGESGGGRGGTECGEGASGLYTGEAGIRSHGRCGWRVPVSKYHPSSAEQPWVRRRDGNVQSL